jgi:hypothetical protein
MTPQTVTAAQFTVLDALRTIARETGHARVLIARVVEAVAQTEPTLRAARVFASLKASGLIGVGRWHVWLTPVGETFFEEGNDAGC